VHANDFMFDDSSPEGVARYRRRALNAVRAIELALAAAERPFDDVPRWLDFGCGYGRVLRFLCERVPPERIWAADVLHEGVDFCSTEFNVHPVYSNANLELAELVPFDFAYAISVLSHLDERNSRAFLRLLGEAVEPNGIVLFTTHGRWSLEHPETYGEEYVRRRAEIARRVDENGICFLRYPFLGRDEYGMAWHSKEYVESTIAELHGTRLELILFAPHGLDGHQDVYAFRRRA
jgi:SAM-dependent methyltransferase